MSNTSFIFQKPKDFYLKRDKEIGPISQIIFSKNYKEFTKLTLTIIYLCLLLKLVINQNYSMNLKLN